MNIFKKMLSLLLCGTMTAAFPISLSANAAAAEAPITQPSVSIITDKKSYSPLATHYMYVINRPESSKYNYHKVAYDMYVKVDNERFSMTNNTSVNTPSDDIITSIVCFLYNDDGSYIAPEILDFQPSQLDKCLMVFPKNGEYTCYVNASTDVTADFIMTIKDVSSPYDSSDVTPPQLDVIVPKPDNYKPGDKVTAYITSNELSNITFGNKTYSECTGVNVEISENGVYTVNAEDVNGNPASKTFTVDFLNSTPDTTTKPTTTTTTTTKPTTTTTTTKPTTTTSTTTTTTTKPTTTTSTTTTTTTKPTTTTSTTTTTTTKLTTTTSTTTTTTTAPTTTTSTTTTTTITTKTEPTTVPTTTTKPVGTTEPPSQYEILLPDASQLYPGNHFKFECSYPDNIQLYWVESSDYGKASCQNGYVYLYKEGTVTLTAHCSDNINIKVTFDIKPKSATTQTTPKPTTTTTTTTTSPPTTTVPTTTTPPINTEPAYTLGDVNQDKKVDSSDASLVLAEYALIQTGGNRTFTEAQKKAADVNKDNKTDSSDASKILEYYAAVSTGKNPTWD